MFFNKIGINNVDVNERYLFYKCDNFYAYIIPITRGSCRNISRYLKQITLK